VYLLEYQGICVGTHSKGEIMRFIKHLKLSDILFPLIVFDKVASGAAAEDSFLWFLVFGALEVVMIPRAFEGIGMLYNQLKKSKELEFFPLVFAVSLTLLAGRIVGAFLIGFLQIR
jgi:hypothetical protein